MLQVERLVTHPLPFVKHPETNDEHSLLVYNVNGASEQTRGLHNVEPTDVSVVHGPSEPILPEHPLDCA